MAFLAIATSSAKQYDVVTLGEVNFEGFELPQRLPFGGKQQVVVNDYIGNFKRQVQVLGAQPREVTWNGTFLYDTALQRAEYLNGLRVAGKPLTLTWGDHKLLVVINEFNYTPNSPYEIPYDISLTVVQDLSPIAATQSKSLDPSNSQLTGIQNQVNTLLGLVGQVQDRIILLKATKNALHL